MQSCAEGGGFRHCQQDERAGVKAAASSAEVSKRRGDHRQKSSTSSCRPYSVKASRISSGATTRYLFPRRGAMQCPPPEDFPRDLGACSPCATSWLSRLFHTSSRPRDAGTNSAEVSTLSSEVEIPRRHPAPWPLWLQSLWVIHGGLSQDGVTSGSNSLLSVSCP